VKVEKLYLVSPTQSAIEEEEASCPWSIETRRRLMQNGVVTEKRIEDLGAVAMVKVSELAVIY
jgi:hypothetical protein